MGNMTKGSIRVHVRVDDEPEQELEVTPTEQVLKSIQSLTKQDTDTRPKHVQVLFGGTPIRSGTFEENSVDDSGRLCVLTTANEDVPYGVELADMVAEELMAGSSLLYRH